MTNTCAKDVLDGPTPTDARKEMVKKKTVKKDLYILARRKELKKSVKQ
jgi:hypothetical protein